MRVVIQRQDFHHRCVGLLTASENSFLCASTAQRVYHRIIAIVDLDKNYLENTKQRSFAPKSCFTKACDAITRQIE
jgi:hypothetical protein